MTWLLPVVLMVASAAPLQSHNPATDNFSRPNSAVRTGFDPALRLTIDNSQVRVFRLDLATNGSAEVSRGIRDYVLLSLTGGALEVGPPGRSYSLDMQPGEPAVLKGGWPHTLRSHSGQPSSWVLLELRSPLAPEKAVCGLAAARCTQFRFGKTDEGEYDESLLFETASVRLSRLELGGGASLPTHHDRMDHVVVPLGNSRVQINGGEIISKAGEPIWVRGGFPEFRNTSGQPSRFVILEIK
jgi:hypothetical protein